MSDFSVKRVSSFFSPKILLKTIVTVLKIHNHLIIEAGLCFIYDWMILFQQLWIIMIET